MRADFSPSAEDVVLSARRNTHNQQINNHDEALQKLLGIPVMHTELFEIGERESNSRLSLRESCVLDSRLSLRESSVLDSRLSLRESSGKPSECGTLLSRSERRLSFDRVVISPVRLVDYTNE